MFIRFLQVYMQKDQRIHYIASQDGTLGIAENTNQAYTLATGDYIVFGDHDDLFEPDALYACVESLNAKRVQVIYTDEDKVDETGDYFFAPNFKPDFNIDLLRCNNYICHMFVAEKNLVDQVGLLNPAFDGAQDYDLYSVARSRQMAFVIFRRFCIIGGHMRHRQRKIRQQNVMRLRLENER